MRIRELQLIRFGKFTDRHVSLPRGAQDIHLIVGPNEAGKSTLRTAISEWLFGIAARTRLDFLHAKSELRLGGRLERWGPDGSLLQALAFQRVKGNKNTLRCPETDQALPETLLLPWLGGLQAGAFNDMHALDHAALVEGSEGILSASDDLGRMLFQSAAGIQHLGLVLKQLDEESDLLWGPKRAAKRAFTPLQDAFQAAKSEIKAHSLRAKQWKDAHKEVHALEAQLQAVRAQNAEKRQRLNQLERIRRVRPLLLQLDQLLAQRQAWMGQGGEPPALPPDAAELLQQAREKQVLATANLARLQVVKGELNAASQAIELQPELLALEADIEALKKRRLQFSQHEADIQLRQQERATAWAGAQDLARRMDWPHDSEAVLRARLPAAPARRQLNRLLKERQALSQAVRSAKLALQTQDEQLQGAREACASLANVPGHEALAEALEQALQLRDHEAQLNLARQAVTQAGEALEAHLAALGPWRMAPESLQAMLPPELARIQALLDDQRSDALEEKTLFDALSKQQAEAQRMALSLQQLVAQHQPVSEMQVRQAREKRQALWLEIQADPNVLAHKAGAFEAQTQAADQLADNRLERAQHEAECQAKTRQIEQAQLAVQQLAERLQTVQTRQAARKADWVQLIQTCGLPALPLEVAPLWVQQRQSVLAAALVHAQAMRAQAELLAQGQQALLALRAGLAEATGEAVHEAMGLGPCVQQAKALLGHSQKTQGQRDALQRQITALQDAVTRLKAEEAGAQRDWAEWEAQWRAALQAAAYAPDVAISQVEADLERMSELEALLATMHTLQVDRIDAMRADLDGLHRSAQALARQLAPDWLARPASAIGLELEQRLQRARQADSDHRALTNRLSACVADMQAAEQQLLEVRASLAPLLEQAGVTELADLQAAIERCDQNRALQSQLAQVQSALQEAGDGLQEAQLRQQVAAWQAGAADDGNHPEGGDALQAQMAQLQEEMLAIEEQIGELSAQHGVCRQQFDALDGTDQAAQAEARRQEALAGMGEVAERYIRLRTEAVLLRWAMEKFRETHQGPMLAKASDLFRQLSLGSFDRLAVDASEDKPRLECIRPGGTRVLVDGLSEGSRDQLYLSLRLAALAQQAGQAEPGGAMPLIADDLFINFDDQRTAAGLRVLGELSRHMQVVFLTHHEHLVPLARDVLGETLNVVAL